MKKMIICLILLLCISGCDNNIDKKFAHFDIKNIDSESTKYTYINDSTNQVEKYIVTDTTPKGSEIYMNGLLYEVNDDDYILLDEFESSNSTADYKFEGINYFSGNKLYIIRGDGATVLEYTLDGTNTSKKDISSKIKLQSAEITKIKDGYIYLKGIDADKNEKNLKCSQKTYKCTNN